MKDAAVIRITSRISTLASGYWFNVAIPPITHSI